MAAELTMAAEKHPLPSWTAPKSPRISSARGEAGRSKLAGVKRRVRDFHERLPVRLPEVFV